MGTVRLLEIYCWFRVPDLCNDFQAVNLRREAAVQNWQDQDNMTNAHANCACPYLGLMDDADTSLTFPSVGSGCHCSRPIASPNLRHQAEYCLSDNHRQCPVFLNQHEASPLPNHLRASHSRMDESMRSPARVFVFVFIGIVALAGLFWGFSTLGLILPNAASTPLVISPTLSPSRTPVATETEPALFSSESIAVIFTASAIHTVVIRTAASTYTPTLTGTVTASPTVFHTPTRIVPLSERQLDVPIGSDYKFLIHKVMGGENFNQYADKYGTSVEAIVTINYKLKTPVWVDTLVVIPVGFTDVASLPAFEAHEVTEAGKSLETLAQELGVSAADLNYYNAIGVGESLLAGDWLLVPCHKPLP